MLLGISKGSIATTTSSLLYYAVCLSHFGAINATVGHELVHKKRKVHKFLGNLVFSKMLYSHFLIQHVNLHHKHVGTPEDASTARFGETLY